MSNSALVACLLLVAAVSLAGCTSIALKDLDEDMPTVLVERYRATKTPYADEGVLELPFLLRITGHVSVTKDGFHAESFEALGPLNLLLSGSSSSDFDEDGRLIRHSSSAGPIWGLLFYESTYKNRVKEASSYRLRILLGALGYRERSDDAKTFYLMYIPIPISRGNDSRSCIKTGEGKERETESTSQKPAIRADP